MVRRVRRSGTGGGGWVFMVAPRLMTSAEEGVGDVIMRTPVSQSWETAAERDLVGIDRTARTLAAGRSSPPGVGLAGDPREAGGGEGIRAGRAKAERFVCQVGETFTDRRGELEAVTTEADADHDGAVAIEHEVVGGARRVQAHGAPQRRGFDAGQPVAGVLLERLDGAWNLRRAIVRIDLRPDAVQAGLDEPIRMCRAHMPTCHRAG